MKMNLTRIAIACSLLMLLLMGCHRTAPKKEAVFLKLQTLRQAVKSGERLLANAQAGNGEGQFPARAFSACAFTLDQARDFVKRQGRLAGPVQIDSVTDAVYNKLMAFEASVHSRLNELIDDRATRKTRYLYHNLKRISTKFMLFGQHDALGYGVGWKGPDTRSDVKDVCGDYPALFSWDAYYIFQTSSDELKHYTFRIRYAHERGGVTSICWHQYEPQGHGFYANDIHYRVVNSILPGGKYHDVYKNKLKKLARYVKRLRGKDGESIPVIFRPYHEQNGNWFWWGKAYRTEDQYVQLWRYTVHYLKDTLGVHNLIYAFSPDGNQFNSREEYLIDYPGDDAVDILGLDFYFGKGDEAEIHRFQKRVGYVVEHATARAKLAALTEVGDYYGFSGEEASLKISDWFTRCFLIPLKSHALAKKVAFGVVWRNASKTHHFAPYPRHPSVPDFLKFYRDDFTLFLNDLPPMFEYRD